MGFFDIGKSVFKKIGAGINKISGFGQDIYDGIGKGLNTARRIADIAADLPVIGGQISTFAKPIFDTVEGARKGLGDVLNVGNRIGEVFEGVKVPQGPGLPGNVEQAPQPLRSAQSNKRPTFNSIEDLVDFLGPTDIGRFVGSRLLS